MEQSNWWEQRWFAALLILASAIPLLWPETPPLVDIPAHMGRLRVQLDLTNSPELQRYFDFQWTLVGNLGVDLLVHPLARLIGLEPAVKLVILSIPPLTAVGLLFMAREIHGRVPAAALFAIPFIYSYPFNYGFANYSLSLALTFLAFGLWLHLERRGRLGLRAALFMPISLLLWMAHAFGWGVFGLLILSTEVVRHRKAGRSWSQSGVRAALGVLPAGLPLLIMVVGHGAMGPTARFFAFPVKALEVIRTLRDRWLLWDCFGVAVGILLIGAAFFDRRLGYSQRLGASVLALTIAFLLMPLRLLGLDFADMRLVPVIFMTALIAIRPKPEHRTFERNLAWLGLAFTILRLASNALSFEIADRQTKKWLTALDHVARGAPVLWLTGDYCNTRWQVPRHWHLGSFVIVRRNGFSNDQWQAPGAQLLRIGYPEAIPFRIDPSEYIFADVCWRGMQIPYHRTTDGILNTFPRSAFDYVWLMDVPDFDPEQPRPDLTPVWRGDRSILYRVERSPK